MAKDYISGVDGLNRKLDHLANQKQMIAASRAALNKALTPVVVTARQKIPKSTNGHKTYLGRIVAPGFASRNIGKKVRSIDGAVTGVVSVKDEAFYALFFETGTKYIRRQPWLTDSFFANKVKMITKFSGGIEAYIKKAARKK